MSPMRPAVPDPARRVGPSPVAPTSPIARGLDPARRQALRTMGALAFVLVFEGPAHAARVVAARVWPAPEYTRLTLESDAAVSMRMRPTGDPLRLAIELEGLEAGAAAGELAGKVRPDDPYIARLRLDTASGGSLLLRIDLKQPTRPQTFNLAPVAAYQHRAVIDLYPAIERDPLLALIQEKQAAEQQARAAVRGTEAAPDKLGSFIDGLQRPAGAPSTAAGATAPPGGSATGGPGTATGSAGRVTPPGAPATTAAAPTGADPSRSTPAPQAVSPALQRRIDRLIIVAIDAGHGGEDPGAIGPTGLKEKDVVLDVARRLQRRINATPGMRAFMTRDADFFVPLGERVRKARRVQADLLVSIHADAFYTPEARGASVFALADRGATSRAARWMADRENAADNVGGVGVSSPDLTLVHTLLDMSVAAQIKDSLKVGNEVLTRIGRLGRLHKPQVEQAGFAVLRAPDIPSILVETAFISNPQEEERLRDPEYRDRLVDAIGDGIERYFARNPPIARNRQI